MNASPMPSGESHRKTTSIVSSSELEAIALKSCAPVNIGDEVRVFREQISLWAASYARRRPSEKSLDASASLRDWSHDYFGVKRGVQFEQAAFVAERGSIRPASVNP
jgi:hypothetical protein